MIKIIKEGTQKIVTCVGCGCVFTYESEDIRRTEARYTDCELTTHYVVCPQCSAIKIVNTIVK